MVDAGDEIWLRRFRPPAGGDGGRVLLFMLPHAGGASSYFFSLARALPEWIEPIGVQYPGRQDRRTEPPVTDLRVLADQIHEVLTRAADRPVALFGHSMGAVISFEVARRMEQADRVRLLGLVASGRRSPSVYRPETVHLRDDAGVIDEIRSLNGTDSGLLYDRELLEMILPAVRADYRAVETYRCDPGARISAPVSVLVGDTDSHVSNAEAWAWRDVTGGEVTVQTFPGGHFYLNKQQDGVVAAVGASLTRFWPALAR